jgi:hypothetical protein
MNQRLCFVALCAIAQGCAAEEDAGLSREPIHGSMRSVAWSGGPAAVRSDPARGVVVRVYEQGAGLDACSLAVTLGRRIEVQLPKLVVGNFDATTDAGFRVEAWDGAVGWSDPSSLAEIDQAPKKKGETLTGRARFGSSLNGDVIEGQFTATLCEDLP